MWRSISKIFGPVLLLSVLITLGLPSTVHADVDPPAVDRVASWDSWDDWDDDASPDRSTRDESGQDRDADQHDEDELERDDLQPLDLGWDDESDYDEDEHDEDYYDKDDWEADWERAWDDDDYYDDDYYDDDFSYRRSSHPRSRSGHVEFRYDDDGYEQVFISGDFTDWHPRDMRLNRREDQWVISLRLDRGEYNYRFEYDDGDGMLRVVDPSARQRKLGGRGWVSVIEVERDGDIWDGAYSARRRVRREFRGNEIFSSTPGDCGGHVGYQRVDGLYLGICPEYIASEHFEPSARARLSYGFKSEEWTASLDILQPIAPRNRAWLKLSAHSGTDFTDQTGIGSLENSLAAAFFLMDFRDYYKREGGAASLVCAALPWLRLEGGVTSCDYESLENHANWSMSKGDFDPNPAIDEGSLRSVFGNLRLGGRYNHMLLEYESSGDDIMGGDFHFEQGVVTTRSRVKLGRDQHLNFRLKGAANLAGRLPIQKRHILGGLGTVRGYDYQSLIVPIDEQAGPQTIGGEQMLLGNVEYSFRLGGDLDLILLYDIGMAWEERAAEIDFDQLRDSVGIALLIDDGDIMVSVAKPLDGVDVDPVVQVRLSRTF